MHRERKLDFTQIFLQKLVPLGPLGLPGNGIELAFDLAQDVVETKHVLLRRLHLPDGCFFTALVLGDPRGLFDVLAPLLGFGLHEVRDAALLHQRVCPGAHTRVHEELFHIEQAAAHLVDGVLAIFVAEDPACDHDLRAVAVGGRKGIPVGLHDERHLGHAHRLRLFAAVEDDIVHLLAAQQRYPLLAHDPADGVNDVALSAPVGPHDTADACREIDNDSVPEGLESDDLEPLEFHSIPMLLSV